MVLNTTLTIGLGDNLTELGMWYVTSEYGKKMGKYQYEKKIESFVFKLGVSKWKYQEGNWYKLL